MTWRRSSGSDNTLNLHLGRSEAGVTLIELMISMALGLFVVMAASALLVSTKSGYLAQDDDVQMQDTGRYAIDIIARAVRQAAYQNWDTAGAPVAATASLGPTLSGLDARSLRSRTAGIESLVVPAVNGSDVLAIRFFGSGTGDNGDGTILNCAGFGVAAPPAAEAMEESRGWSIFYVAHDASGEPELYCKYRGDTSWASQSIARGVESFQVLYGLDTDMDGLPNRLLNATAINAMDDALVLQGANAAERAVDKNRKTHWKRVVAVKVALLIRGAHVTRGENLMAGYALFGEDYANGHANVDAGVRIREADLPRAVRGRARRFFTSTIRLRNGSLGSAG